MISATIYCGGRYLSLRSNNGCVLVCYNAIWRGVSYECQLRGERAFAGCVKRYRHWIGGRNPTVETHASFRYKPSIRSYEEVENEGRLPLLMKQPREVQYSWRVLPSACCVQNSTYAKSGLSTTMFTGTRKLISKSSFDSARRSTVGCLLPGKSSSCSLCRPLAVERYWRLFQAGVCVTMLYAYYTF